MPHFFFTNAGNGHVEQMKTHIFPMDAILHSDPRVEEMLGKTSISYLGTFSLASTAISTPSHIFGIAKIRHGSYKNYGIFMPNELNQIFFGGSSTFVSIRDNDTSMTAVNGNATVYLFG